VLLACLQPDPVDVTSAPDQTAVFRFIESIFEAEKVPRCAARLAFASWYGYVQLTRASFFPLLLPGFAVEQLSAECGIMMLAYIDRIIENAGGITLHASNWRRITLSTLILASKGSPSRPLS